MEGGREGEKERGREVENGVAVIGRVLKRRERKGRIRFPSRACVCARACVCVSVCARACVCVCVCVYLRQIQRGLNIR